MTDAGLYHEGNHTLQEQFDSRRIADRLEEVTVHQRFLPGEREMIEGAYMFFLATADAGGWPDVSYKGGLPGFVRVVSDDTLAFPNYDGNGMFKSLGNLLVNPKVGLLFIDFEDPGRMRVQGTASLSADDPLMADFPGAQLIVRVKAERIFPNCPRYVHRMHLVEESIYAPSGRHTPPVPDWKRMPVFNDALPQRGPAACDTD
ncbi:MAG: pyridoxamine 5'-phosphate oxidase family protein [Dehalococcoidia bacterium]|nr:pyridoxamine 5'-phosphate oxidase family protein [Dehalococcoidia bacterium]